MFGAITASFIDASITGKHRYQRKYRQTIEVREIFDLTPRRFSSAHANGGKAFAREKSQRHDAPMRRRLSPNHRRVRLLLHSTVTDFARLRGWSTSVPRSTAM